MMKLADLETPRKSTWCPGCGNFGILTAVRRAIIELNLEPEKVLLVSGIGCHGKIVNYINVNGFHGIHGRVLPVATGAKLANHELTVIGFAGDGDAYAIGIGHLSHAARRNVDITYIVHNNMVFGLTAGQTSPTSQKGFKTKSSPHGAVELPINPIAHALASDATFIARGFAGEVGHLTKLIMEAIKHRGFALVDVLQPCRAFNYLNTYSWYKERVYKLDEEDHDINDKKKAFEKSLEWGDRIPIGIFYREVRPTYQDETPQILGEALVKYKIESIDITQLLESFT